MSDNDKAQFLYCLEEYFYQLAELIPKGSKEYFDFLSRGNKLRQIGEYIETGKECEY